MGIIRLMLALGVVLHHVGHLGIINGGLAVEMFFVISGFYMALVLDAKYASDTGLFYSNRLLRLAPAYFAALALQAAAILWLDAGYGFSRAEFLAAMHGSISVRLALASNITVLGQEWMNFLSVKANSLVWDPRGLGAPAWQLMLLPQAWSISLELMFYAIAPFIARRPRLIGGLFALSLALRIGMLAQGWDYASWVRRFFPSTLHLFLLGMLVFHGSQPLKRRLAALPVRIPGAAAVLLAVIMILLHRPTPFNQAFLYPLTCLYLALIVPLLFYGIRSNADRLLGELSYPVYTFHILVIGLLARLLGLHSFALGVAALIAVLISAGAFYFLVEAPIDGWRQRRAERRKSVADQSP